MKFIVATVFSGVAAAFVVPSNVLAERATFCGQYDSEVTGTYTVYNDLWGESSATSGSQCTIVNSDTNGVLSWSTSWTWAGGSYSVKSYANAVVSISQQSLSSISSIPTQWTWSYTGNDMVADVSYDMFTGTSASASASYEVMVWLASYGGAGPISSSGSPVATPTIAGYTWNLFEGPNGATTVFSFVAQSNIQSFSGDLKDFFDYLISNESLSSSQILQSIGAGTEPFTGSDAVLTTQSYTTSVE